MIELLYEDHEPEEWYVRGHVSDDEAIADVRSELEREVRHDERASVPALGEVRRTYARWGLGRDDGGEVLYRCFHLHVAKKRGAFAVTVVHDLDAIQCDLDEQAARQASADEFRAWLQAKYPTATNIDVSPWPPHRATWHLPELHEPAYMRSDKRTTASVVLKDVETFTRLYGRTA